MKVIAILLVGLHNHRIVKNSLFTIFCFLVVSLSSCSKSPKNNQDFIISNCAKDTFITLNNIREQYVSRPISLKVSGNIDDSAELLFEENKKNISGVSPIMLNLKKGKVDFKEQLEIYAQDYRIVYLHGNATKGQLKIRFQLLNPSGDTLTDK